MRHEIDELKEGFDHADTVLASSAGGESHKKLIIRTRFDGFGNSVVRFIVVDHDAETPFEKYNAAVIAYNMAK